MALSSDAQLEIASAPKFRVKNVAWFACDSRTYGSQVKSCEEAQYFLRHYPKVNIDGNNGGIRCEYK